MLFDQTEKYFRNHLAQHCYFSEQETEAFAQWLVPPWYLAVVLGPKCWLLTPHQRWFHCTMPSTRTIQCQVKEPKELKMTQFSSPKRLNRETAINKRSSMEFCICIYMFKRCGVHNHTPHYQEPPLSHTLMQINYLIYQF